MTDTAFVQALKVLFLGGKGRFDRIEFLFMNIIGYIVAQFLVRLIEAFAFKPGNEIYTFVLISITTVFTWICTSLYVRRVRDIGWPWWTVFLIFIPVANGVFFLFLLFAKGKTS